MQIWTQADLETPYIQQTNNKKEAIFQKGNRVIPRDLALLTSTFPSKDSPLKITMLYSKRYKEDINK